MIYHKPQNIRDTDFLPNQNEALSDKPIFILARQAIYNFFKNSEKRRVYLPCYLPEGVYYPFTELGLKKMYYSLSEDLRLPDDFPGSCSPDETIIYYIHHFGLYNQENIDKLKQLKSQGYYIVEDRALTLPSAEADYFGDATVYSYNKMLGVPHGGMIFSESEAGESLVETNNDAEELKSYLSLRMNLFSHSGINLMPQLFFRLYNKIAWKLINRKAYISSHWLPATGLADSDIVHLIQHLDFQTISEKIIHNAGFLFDNIRPELRLFHDRKQYTVQAIAGFPILTNDPRNFQGYLMKNGIHGFVLSHRWRPVESAPLWENTFQHFLLPAHHDLRKKDLEKIVRVVNAYKFAR